MGVDNMPPDIFRLLMPYTSKMVEKAKKNRARAFIHYTSADAFLKILESKEVWLRNAATMNDFSEVEYGLSCLAHAWEGEVGLKFKTVLDKIAPGVVEALRDHHNGWQSAYKSDTYLFAVSEHKTAENSYGRLSMWREYARNSGVGFVLDTAAFETETQLLSAYTVPVLYADQNKFDHYFNMMSTALETHSVALSKVNREQLIGSLFQVFRFISMSTKHPAFEEELEWRVVYNPDLDESQFIEKRIVSIGGVPQKICALGLQRIEQENDVLDLTIESLLKTVIIGPTDQQLTIGSAIIEALTKAGVSNASEKVRYSNIPVKD